ncbi:hypothetical protein BDA99DRAFT_542544 [Phascolomyces articulosus]|uniref:Glutathione S-transferase 3, mitochondrial n=1 Tax=Phascolomyces articulosus TaxID=60185 RepID=A0AAD5JPG7_9FUNG|nr:hypothetical protein BDA99DRAFT_542544 [Phascolomyces articulosus]
MPTDIVIPSAYGYVISIAILSVVQLTVMGGAVFGARKRAGVPYPLPYADKAEAETDFDKHVFNCKQRVHQNTLENFPTFGVLLFTGGISYPEITAGAGLAYLLSRVFYARGYSTGTPEKRGHGRFGMLGTLVMLGTSVATVYKLLI